MKFPDFSGRLLRTALLLFSLCALSAFDQRSAPAVLPLTPEIKHWLDQRWVSLRPTEKRNVSTRDFFSFMRMAAGALDLAR